MFGLPIEILFICVLVIANGVLAMAETAVVSARKSKLRRLADAGDSAAKQALALAANPARFLALVEFWLTLSSTIAGVIGGARLAGPLGVWLARTAVLAPYAPALAFVIVALGLTAFVLLFGELVPKRIGLAYPERVAGLLAGTMRTLAWLAAPSLRLFELATEGILRLIRFRPDPGATVVSEDEVRALVEQGLHAGVFQRAEQQMVEGVLALDQRSITTLMTPRPKMVFLNLEDSEEINWRKIVTSGHSHFPVFHGNRDQVVGMVSVKAIWANSAIGLPATLKNLVVTPLTVPETLNAAQLLEQFKRSGKHLAIVTDEFGAVQGLVTLIDVFEAIVGDLPDHGPRQAQPEVRRREDGSWLIDATLPVAELKTLLGLKVRLPREGEADYKTLGGFVMTYFGRIPVAGDWFVWAGWRFEVVDMDRHRIDKLLVSRTPAPAAPA
jgi:putative hemolysin